MQIPRRFVAHPWGGTETVVLETSKRLIASGHPTDILTTTALSNERKETIEGVPIQRFPRFYPYLGLDQEAIHLLDQKGGNLFSFALLRALQQVRPLDVIHLHTGKRLGGIARMVALKRRIPYIVSLHGGLLDVPLEESRTWTQPTEGKLEWGKALGAWVGARRVLDDAAAVVCVSSGEAAIVRKSYPNVRVEMLPNGVDPLLARQADGSRFRAEVRIPPKAPIVAVIGRIDPQKGQLTAVEAVALLRDRIPDLRLVLIGGVTNDDYYRRIQEAIGPWVSVIPGYPRGDGRLWDAYAAADLVLIPSRHEPFGIVALEAWSARRPLVASAVGGLAELVANGDDGVLVPTGDPRALADAIDTVLRNPELAASMADSGFNKVAGLYTWNAITTRLIQLYEEVAHAHPVRS